MIDDFHRYWLTTVATTTTTAPAWTFDADPPFLETDNLRREVEKLRAELLAARMAIPNRLDQMLPPRPRFIEEGPSAVAGAPARKRVQVYCQDQYDPDE